VAYNDLTTFPRGLYYNTFAATRDVALAAHGDSNHPMRIAWILLSSEDAAAKLVTFTDGDDTTIMQAVVPITDTLVPIPGWYASNGLKAKTQAGEADMYITVAYYDDTDD
jgi:hypothetical protein